MLPSRLLLACSVQFVKPGWAGRLILQGLQFYAGIERYDPTVCDTARWAAASAATLQRSQSERAKAIQMLSGNESILCLTWHSHRPKMLSFTSKYCWIFVKMDKFVLKLSTFSRHRESDQRISDGDLGPMEQLQQCVYAAHRRNYRNQEQTAVTSA